MPGPSSSCCSGFRGSAQVSEGGQAQHEIQLSEGLQIAYALHAERIVHPLLPQTLGDTFSCGHPTSSQDIGTSVFPDLGMGQH